MAISVTEAIKQNTVGNSEGLPKGVPTDYSWYNGASQESDSPPSSFASVGGWGQVYQEQGSSYSNPNATVDVANAQTWVHLKTTGQWVQVQNQANDSLEGGHFVEDFSGNAGTGMTVTSSADGTATMPTPPTGYNDHFWHVGRGQFDPGTVDGVYVQMDMKISDPNVKAVANIGADWWPTPTADYVDGFANNPGAGMSNWIELTGQYKTLAFYSGSAAEFQASPPPALTGAAVTDPKPSVPSNATSGASNEAPVVTNPVDSTAGQTGGNKPIDSKPIDSTTDQTGGANPVNQTAGTNLLRNGSFEAPTLDQGTVGLRGQIDGWTALSGSKIEVWNDVNGVSATNGSNFVELDYDTGRDGFSQTVKTGEGQTSTVSIDARARPGENPESSGIEVVWNDKVVSTIRPGADWKTYNVDVTGTGGTDNLTLREPQDQSADGVGALVDNVQLVAKTPSTDATATNSSLGRTTAAATDSAGAAGTGATTSTSKADVTTAVSASASGKHPFEVGNRTLGFSADTSASAPSTSAGSSGDFALLRQQLASAFGDTGGPSAATPIHDRAAATWGQTLAQPRA